MGSLVAFVVSVYLLDSDSHRDAHRLFIVVPTQELLECTDSEGQSLVTMNETDSTIWINGTLFVQLVSPYRFCWKYLFIRSVVE